MYRLLPMLVAGILPLCSFAQETGVRLKYVPQVTVAHRNEVIVEIEQTEEKDPICVDASQTFRADLTLQSKTGEGLNASILQPPADVTFVLKRYYADLILCDKEFVFDSSRPDENSQAEFAQIPKLVDRPVNLHFENAFQVQVENPEVQQLLSGSSLLQGLKIEPVLGELFQHLFVLAGKDLVNGAKYHAQTANGSAFKQPMALDYTITSITPLDVSANISGKMDKQSMTLVEGEASGQDKISYVYSCTVKGQVSWSRSNALIYQLKNEYLLQGKVKIGKKEYPLQIKIRHGVETRL